MIKVAPVLRLAILTNLHHSVWFTGQHKESIEDLIADFELTSSFSMPRSPREHSSVGGLTRWLPRALRDCRHHLGEVAATDKSVPLVVVHGDTLSTVVGAMAARSVGMDVVHLESGLTSMNLLDPFPEEILRRLTFKLARYAICPNAKASSLMRRSSGCEVIDTGENTMLDCVRFAVSANQGNPDARSGPYFVASIHRFENIYRKSRLKGIVDDIVSAGDFANVSFVLHPPTERRLRKYGLLELLSTSEGVHLEPRMPFTRFLALISNALGVFSDGGSNQEELSYLGVPTVLFRERSERPDGLGANIVLRRDIGASLSRFIRSGELDALRQPTRLSEDVQPSQITVAALRQWSDRMT